MFCCPLGRVLLGPNYGDVFMAGVDMSVGSFLVCVCST